MVLIKITLAIKWLINTFSDIEGFSMKAFKVSLAVVITSGVALLSGCTGQVYNQQKNCSYDYLFTPTVSISKMIGGCGPIDTITPQK